ncbi:TRAP transporter small permease [Teredinibacter sp. KSP-S5-2]|uniref:TRAP transporter small permease n=1 Tax=Teredinibacter sp. KSP-S5-2 TaxID=3034506 RepID=UPI0029347E5D|nr:TRAP transporter small permease [Teredinibacter sp. KSP-S5-2]WNO09650.1 TRAP transporter small permease [Teredinibacter sp. KSP-S5-2]
MSFFKKIGNGFHQVEIGLLVVIPIVAVVLSVLQIFLRNFFESSLPWIDPIVRITVLWIGLLGAMIATRHYEHICIDISSHYLSKPLLSIVYRVIALFSSAICGLMAYHSIRYVIEERAYESTMYADIPSWPFQAIIPIAFAVMCLRFFIQVFKVPTLRLEGER